MKNKQPRWSASQNKTTSRNGHTIQLRKGIYYVDGVAQHMPDEWLDAFSAAGTPEQVADAIQRLAAVGADSIVFQPLNGDPDCLDEYIHDLMPRLKSQR